MTALYVHAFILWIAFFGMVALPANTLLHVRAKQLGALTFAVLIIESVKVT